MNKYKNIVIFTCSGIGDFIWATSAVSLIKDCNNDENVNLNIVTFSSYVSLIDEKLHINKIISMNYKLFYSKKIIIRWVYKIYLLIKFYFFIKNFDILVCLDKCSFFTMCAKYVYKIKDIVGPNNCWFGYDIKNNDLKYYSKIIDMPKDSDRNHCMMRYQQIIRRVFPTNNLSLPVLPDTSYLSSRVNKIIGNTKKYRIAICSQGSAVWKCFGFDYLFKLFLMLKTLNNVTFFIIGSDKKQKQEADLLKNKLKNVDIQNICCATSLLELKEFFKNIDLLISVDTGVIHLAAAVNLPTISFHGATLPEQTSPINPKAVALYSNLKCVPCNSDIEEYKKVCFDPKCIYNIDVRDVLYNIKEILNI